MKTQSALVIGANGGIGRAVVETLAAEEPDKLIYAVSRSENNFAAKNVISVALDTADEQQVQAWLRDLVDVSFRYVVGCTGILHQHGESAFMPEKKLEDITPEALSQYFQINTILPALWLKHLVNYVDKEASAICFISARVGSIGDNRLGGWYGYRASKAGLNMIMQTAAIEYKRRTKNTAFLCYHPGTVDTPLSTPFQRNVKPEKLFTSQFSAECLVKLLREVDVENSPHYIDWAGKPIDW